MPRARWLWVATGTSRRIALDLRRREKPSVAQSRPRPGRRCSPCAHGHAFMPWAVTPTMRRLVWVLAAAMPMSPYISWVGMSVTGVRFSTG